ncbi:hypothetical protein VaNZ11_003337 [Volvox africanus]|uniref:Uncharacterized protein n=1 Tax=Volvox africanus TaxID=51714 RepID=A0ABQ5RVL7_9CHLO|nr:hypothetical protein VaNZ11_003337 [Volvox africanus]
MATNQDIAVHTGNRQDLRRSWATCCATTNDVSAKRLEVYLTMQRQYAEQLKLSQALSARLDVMASQSMVLQEVLLAALAKLDSAKAYRKRKVGAFGAESDGTPSSDNAGQNRGIISLQPPLAAAAAPTTAATRISSPSVAAVVRPPPPVVSSYSGSDGGRLFVQDSQSSPFGNRLRLLANATTATAAVAATPSWSVSNGNSDVCCPLPPPPPPPSKQQQQPQRSASYTELPTIPSEESSLPAAPHSTCSTAATGRLASTELHNNLTINDPTTRRGLAEGLVTANVPAAGNCSHVLMEVGTMEAMEHTTSSSGVSNKRLRTHPAFDVVAAAAAAALASKPEALPAAVSFPVQPMKLQPSQTPLQIAQQRPPTLGGSSESAASGGGCSGSSCKSGRQWRGDTALGDNGDADPQPTATASSGAALEMGTTTALHSPLVFTPSYFSHPHVVQQLLQLQGQLRRDPGDSAPLVRPEPAVRQAGDGAYLLGCQVAATPASAAAAAAAVPSTALCRMSAVFPMSSRQVCSCSPSQLLPSVYGNNSCRLFPPYDTMAVSLGRQVPGSSPTPVLISVARPGATNTWSEVGSGTVSEPCIGIQIASPSPYSSSPPAAASDCSNSSSLLQGWAMQASLSPSPLPPPGASTPPTQGLRPAYPTASTTAAISATAATTSAAATAGADSFQSWQIARAPEETGFTVRHLPLRNGFQQSCVVGGVEALGLWSGLDMLPL